MVEKHYVSKRGQAAERMLAFLAKTADHARFCYANGELRTNEQNDEILACRVLKHRTSSSRWTDFDSSWTPASSPS